MAACGAWSADDAPAAQVRHRFACTDYSGGKAFIVSTDGSVEWEYPAEHCNDLQVLPNGNLLFNTGHGVVEVTPAREVVFRYESASAIYACQRLPDGNTFVGECNSGRLLEIAPDGRIVKEVRILPAGQKGGPAYMRNARRLGNGHYLVAHYGADVVREYDANGALVRELPAPGGPHSVERLANGNTLISTADHPGGPRLIEVDPAGRPVWEVLPGDLPGVTLRFLAGFQRLPNGNTVVANWLGHGHLGERPQVVEITPDKHVAWVFSAPDRIKSISNIRILDTTTPATEALPH